MKRILSGDTQASSAARRNLCVSISIILATLAWNSSATAETIKFTDGWWAYKFTNPAGFDWYYKYKVDTQFVIGERTLECGAVTTFDYKQTYLMECDPPIRGTAELVPGNTWDGSTPQWSEDLYPIHFEHDLFAGGCLEFVSLTGGSLKTNSPDTGGDLSLTIGPVEIGGSWGGTGDTEYTVHLDKKRVWVDWTTDSSRGGFFHSGGFISLTGTVKCEDFPCCCPGTGYLKTDNRMYCSGHHFLAWAEPYDEELFMTKFVTRQVDFACVPAPGALALAGIGVACTRWWFRRR